MHIYWNVALEVHHDWLRMLTDWYLSPSSHMLADRSWSTCKELCSSQWWSLHLILDPSPSGAGSHQKNWRIVHSMIGWFLQCSKARIPGRLRGGDIGSSLDESSASLTLGSFIVFDIAQRRFPVLNCRLIYSGDDTLRLLIFNETLSIGRTVPAKVPTFITFFSYSERVSPGAKPTSRTQSRKKYAKSKTASVWATLRPMHARGPIPNIGTSSSDTPSHLDGLNCPGFLKVFGLRTNRKLHWKAIVHKTGPMTYKY